VSLCIVIVSYNVRDLLRDCLRTLADQRVIVVDNASADGSAAMVRTEFPTVELIANTDNRGFAAACNQGIATSTEDFVLILNPDTLVTAAALRKLSDIMQAEPRTGACGPRILNPNGSLQPSCRRFPTLPRLLLDEFSFGKLFPRSKFFGDYRMTWWAHDEPREVDQLMGAALLLRRKALEQVGVFDERFFMYFEEVDLCVRLHNAGWKILFVPDAQVMHHGGQSARQELPEATLYRYRSLGAFYRKHYPAWHWTVLKMAIGVAVSMRVILYTFRPAKRAAFSKVLRNICSL
jgi:N-acetylglucosaminyl-diphospho-decaprenol L-rhamnosyltransferase